VVALCERVPSPSADDADDKLDGRVAASVLGLLAILAAVQYFRGIGAQPIHVDEALYLLKLGRIIETGTYQYEPFFHGPLLYYLSWPVLPAFDYSMAAARSVTAMVGLLLFPALYALRKEFSLPALVTSAMLFALHPWIIRFAQYYRRDLIGATLLLVVLASYLRYRRVGTRGWAFVTGVALAAAIATTAIVWPALVLLTVPIAAMALVDLVGTWGGTGSLRDAMITVGRRYLPGAVPTLVVTGVTVSMFFYAGWPLTVDGFLSAPDQIVKGVNYWIGHDKESSGLAAFLNTEFRLYKDWLVTDAVVLGTGLLSVATTAYRSGTSWARWVVIGYWIQLFLFASVVVGYYKPLFLPYLLVPLILMIGWTVVDIGTVLGASSVTDGVTVRQAILGSRLTGRQAALSVLLACLLVSSGLVFVSEPRAPQSYLQYSSWDPHDGGVQSTLEQYSAETGCSVIIEKEYWRWLDRVPRWSLRDANVSSVLNFSTSEQDGVLLSHRKISTSERYELETIDVSKPVTYPGKPTVEEWYVYTPRADANGRTPGLKPMASVSSQTLLQGATGLDVAEDYAYVASRFNASLTVVDVSTPSDSAIVGSVRNATTLSGASDVVTDPDADHVYVMTKENKSIVSVNISDPTEPRIVGSVSADSLKAGDDLTRVGDTVFVGVSYPGDAVTTVNVSDPATPRLAGTVSGRELDNVQSVHVSDGYAYAVAEEGSDTGHVAVLDISDVSAPNIVTILRHGSLYEPKAVTTSPGGEYAYVGSQNGNVTVLNITDPQAPTVTTSLESAGGIEEFDRSGDYVFTATSTGRLVVFDVSDPASPVEVERQSSFGSTKATGIATTPTTAYSVDPDNGQLNVYDRRC